MIPWKQLYPHMLILLQLHGTSRKPACRGLEKADQIKERWITMDKASKREGRIIRKRWTQHKGCWTLSQLKKVIEEMEEIEEGEGAMAMSQEEERLLGMDEADENDQISRKPQEQMDTTLVELRLIEEEVGTESVPDKSRGGKRLANKAMVDTSGILLIQLIKDFADKVEIQVDKGSNKGKMTSRYMRQGFKKRVKEQEQDCGK